MRGKTGNHGGATGGLESLEPRLFLNGGVEGTGTVYIPNPIDDPAMHSVTLTDLDGSGYLRGASADVTNSLAPRAYNSALQFDYDPSGPSEDRVHFAETMAYYYITEYNQYVQSLGFTQVSTPVSAVVFAAQPVRTLWIPIPSTYDPNTRTVFLSASTDLDNSDAYDADLIVHEYAHAIQHQLRGGLPGSYVSPSTTSTEQGQALMEALADYSAVSRYDNPRWGEWAAAIWNGQPFWRNLDNFYRWPGDFLASNAYRTGMIFSGAMWDLRAAVGQEVADTLAWTLVQTVPDNNPATSELNTTFADALTTLLQADTSLYGGVYQDTIRQAFAVHGLGSFDFSTPFPMVRDPGNNYNGVQVYSLPGASALTMTFDRFVTKLDDLPFTKDELPSPSLNAKSTADWLIILDGTDTEIGRFTGRELQGATITVPGDTVKFHLVTDASRAPFGYRVVDIAAVQNTNEPPVVTGVTLNGRPGRTVSAVEPSGIGVQTITVRFSEPVNFAADSVRAQTVTFANSQETPLQTLTPLLVEGTGTDTMTVSFASGSVVDAWVKVELRSSAIADLAGSALDGEPLATGTGRGYIYDASLDLPSGDGVPGGDAVFYVGSLRGDFATVPGELDHRITEEDLGGFLGTFESANLDADFRGVGFGADRPDGQITPGDIDGFISVYNQAVAEGRHLDLLPNPGPQNAGGPEAVALPGAEPATLARLSPIAPALNASLSLAEPEASTLGGQPEMASTAPASDVMPTTASPMTPVLSETETILTADRGLAIEAALAWSAPRSPALPQARPVLSPDGGVVDLLALPALELPLGT
jgi:hypothetical protein